MGLRGVRGIWRWVVVAWLLIPFGLISLAFFLQLSGPKLADIIRPNRQRSGVAVYRPQGNEIALFERAWATSCRC